MAALKRMTARDRGKIVQVGSALSYRAIPLQAAYCGAKFGIRGFTDSIRTELLHDRSKVQITMVQLPGVNTTQFNWCRSKLPNHPQPVPPIYQPEIPAEAVYWAAHHRRRELWVGYSAVEAIVGNMLAPSLADRYLAKTGFSGQQIKDMPVPADRPNNLFAPVPELAATHGMFDDKAKTRSPQLWATTHRHLLAGALGATAAAAAATGIGGTPAMIQAPVSEVRVAAYKVPTEQPESDGTLSWDAVTLVAVEVDAGGLTGLGYTYADESAAALISSTLGDVVKGRDALTVPGCWWAMVHAIRNLGWPGISATAISAIDIALWDLKAKLLDLALADLLGRAHEAVPVYGSGGLTSYSEHELCRQLDGWVQQGITRVKMKIGRDPEADLRRVQAVREAIGPNAELYVDANGAYRRKQALAQAVRMREHDVTWFEEPVSSNDLEGLRLIRDQGPPGMSIAAGEYGYDPGYFRRMLQAGAVDVMQADATPLLRDHRPAGGRRAVHRPRGPVLGPLRSRCPRPCLRSGGTTDALRVLPHPCPRGGDAVRRRARAGGRRSASRLLSAGTGTRAQARRGLEVRAVSSAGAQALARVTAPHILREYALLADGERGILLGPRGDYSWMCFPRWDSDACFASLIGGQGVYAVTPAARFVWGGYYEHGLIWCSRWVTDDGALIECREALALPSSPDRAVVLRRIVVRTGSAKIDVVLDLRAGFGKTPAKQVARADDGTWSAQAGDAHMRWVGAAKAKPRADGHGARPLVMQLELEEGEVHDLVLVLDAGGDAEPVPDPDHAWSGTEAAWHERLPELPYAVGHRDAQHSYAVLQGLTSAGGGMVAAATMSLPERAREGRNYDYRYVWIRDQCLTGQAVAKAGAYSLMDDAVRFVCERLLEDGPKMVPAYTVTGGAVPDQRTLGLPGYPGGTDVVGNWVNQQFQLDAFGESLLLFAAASGHDHLDADGWRAAETAIAAIEQRWQEPDAGIWELEPDNWTHSRLICAAGLRAIAARQSSREGGAMGRAGRRDRRRDGRPGRAPRGPLAALPRRPPRRRGPAAAGDPRRDPR